MDKRSKSGRWLERLPVATDRPWLALAVTLSICGTALLLRMAADSNLPPGFPYVTFFPAVTIAAFLFGTRMGIVASAVCGLAAWYYFIPYTHSFALAPGGGMALALYLFVVMTEVTLIHWMQRANANLARQREISGTLAETQSLLFRELQHRVSNNLQVVAGLLSLQKREIEDPHARAALDEAARRLGVIGRISRQLYDPTGATRGMRAFLEPLCADVIEASGRTGIRLRLIAGEDTPLSPDAAIPLALIVAEAVANAIEHGFANRDDGEIQVELRRDGASMSVEVRDDGHGLPDGFDIDTASSLGLRIARMLAGQIDGRFDLVADNGTTARLSLPA
jgi:two-component sensor histidine kinase